MRPEPAVHQRLARPQRDAPEAELHALPRERRLDEIVLADRGAAEGDEHVGAGILRREDALFERLEGVAGDAEIDRLAARALDERGNRIGVRGDDLVRPGRLAGQDEFVAGGEDRDARLAADGERAVTHRGGEREAPRIEPRPGSRSTSPCSKSSPAGRM